jgi:putative addiction module component (TIGR02574 family)
MTMSRSVDEIKSDLRALSSEEKLIVLDELLASLNDEAAADIREIWRIEIERRVSDIKAGRAKPVPADQVFERARQRLR